MTSTRATASSFSCWETKFIHLATPYSLHGNHGVTKPRRWLLQCTGNLSRHGVLRGLTSLGYGFPGCVFAYFYHVAIDSGQPAFVVAARLGSWQMCSLLACPLRRIPSLGPNC